jgi:hypothetical protein
MVKAVVEQIAEVKEPVKKTRTMTPEMLAKLAEARAKAVEARKKSRGVNDELVQIRSEIKKEKLGDKVNEVETYHKLKAKVEDEVKQKEIVAINQRLNDMHSKFDGFLQDRQQRKVEKAQRKQEKSGKELARALPAELAKKMIQQEL